MKTSFVKAMLALTLIVLSAAATAQTSVRVRGTVTAFDGKFLAVKSSDDRDLKLQLASDTVITYPKPIALADLKPGEYVGITSTRNTEGMLVAREVHTISSTANEGHRPMAEQPGSTMTNANIAKSVKSTSGQELTLEYKGGSQTILVPDGTPIVTSVAADRTLLVPGASVAITALAAADGAMTAQRIQASKPGVRPLQ